ncbi:MAG: carbohydrate kinase family protein [Treponema sp.]|nr:carbohydrate kinase family protein [Treponema sp.]
MRYIVNTENVMITIHGTGCCLMDFLYPKTDFSVPAFTAKLSRQAGDGGLGIGKLVFAEDFERFVNAPYESALREIAGGAPSYNLGGPAVVSLVHAAQVLGDRAAVSFYGSRGADKTGDLVEEALSRAGFVPRGQAGPADYILKRCPGLTPRTDVLSDPNYHDGHGERTFINLIGAAGRFSRADLDSTGDFFDASVITFGGTALTPLIHDGITELLRRAKKRGALTMVNLVYDYRSELAAPGKKWKLGARDDAYGFIDLLVADRDEALKTSGCPSEGEAAGWFLDKGCGAAVITSGTRPLHFAAGKGIFSPLSPGILPVSKGIDRELAAHPERRGDTTGCGDNFAGGLIAGLVEQLARTVPGKLDLREACIPGVVAGGYACFTLGGVFYEKHPGEKRELLAPFIEEYKKELR